MHQFLIEHSTLDKAENLFDLVSDIESYPLFLPACQKAEILERGVEQGKNSHQSDNHKSGNKAFVKARLTIGRGLLRESFTSYVSLDRSKRIIKVHLLEGRLKYLNCQWDFTQKGKECHVRCALDFEFQSALSNRLFMPLLNPAISKLVKSFIDQAHRRSCQPAPTPISKPPTRHNGEYPHGSDHQIDS